MNPKDLLTGAELFRSAVRTARKTRDRALATANAAEIIAKEAMISCKAFVAREKVLLARIAVLEAERDDALRRNANARKMLSEAVRLLGKKGPAG